MSSYTCPFCNEDTLIFTNECQSCTNCSRTTTNFESQAELMPNIQSTHMHTALYYHYVEICHRYSFPKYLAEISSKYYSELRAIKCLKKKSTNIISCFSLLKMLSTHNICRNLKSIFRAFLDVKAKDISNINSLLISIGKAEMVVIIPLTQTIDLFCSLLTIKKYSDISNIKNAAIILQTNICASNESIAVLSIFKIMSVSNSSCETYLSQKFISTTCEVHISVFTYYKKFL